MHVRHTRTTSRSPPIVQKHVERDWRAVRLTQVFRDEIAGHVAADPESCVGSRPEITDIPRGERTDLRLAMSMKQARWVEPGIENAFGDRLDTRVGGIWPVVARLRALTPRY